MTEIDDPSASLTREIDKLEEFYKRCEERLYADLPPSGYAAPMLISLALKRGNLIVDRTPRYSSADHGTLWTNVIKILQKLLRRDDFVGPHFGMHDVEDPRIKELLGFENAKSFASHLRGSMENGIWKIERVGTVYSATISPYAMRSALHLLSNKAENYEMSHAERALIRRGPEKTDLVKLGLATGVRILEPLRNGTQGQWDCFLKEANLSENGLITFLAFFSWLSKARHAVWTTKTELLAAFKTFTSKYGKTQITTEEMERLLSVFAVTPDEAAEWGLPAPFVQTGDFYIRWHFAFHVLHPNLTLLALLMRRYPNAWNTTVGSASASVAQYLIRDIERDGKALFATCRVKKNLGDIDIAVLNPRTGDLMLCEVKTVFDRFRTNFQASNFSEQRVNYEKAERQLRQTSAAISSGDWKLSDIFGEKLPIAKPANIVLVVLTWWDIYDPFQNTPSSDVAVSNFAVFRYFLRRSDGDVMAIHEALLQLASIRCPAKRRSIEVQGEEVGFQIMSECQTDVLPPRSAQNLFGLNKLAIEAISDVACFPEDWMSQLRLGGEDPVEYVM